MANDTPLRFLLADLGRPDGPADLPDLVQERGSLLIGTPGVASALVSDGEMDDEFRLALFHMLVDEARMDMENRGRLGKRFLAEAADAIAALGEAGGLDLEAGAMLVRAYASAGIEPPEDLMPSVQEGALAEIASDEFPDDLDAQIKNFRREYGDDDYMLHSFLNSLLGGMPAPLQAAFVQYMADGGEAWCGTLALYWLLSPVPEVRLAAASGLEERARRGGLAPAAAATLTLIRTWMPADGALPVLDAVLREARRQGPVEPPEAPALQPGPFLGSLPDGSGSQSFTVSLEGAGGPAAAFILLKAGHGVKDAFLVQGQETADAMLAQLARNSEMYSIGPGLEALEPVLSAALAEGLAEGKAAPPGLIDVARACGFGALQPQAMTVRDWLARVDPGGEVAHLPADERAGLVERSGDWPLEHDLTGTWFEGTAMVDEALEGVNGSRQPSNTALWAALGKRRGYWALLMARAAHVLRLATGERDWRSFVATATALIDGEELEGIPIMQQILDSSVAAWEEEEDALDAGGATEGGRLPRA